MHILLYEIAFIKLDAEGVKIFANFFYCSSSLAADQTSTTAIATAIEYPTHSSAVKTAPQGELPDSSSEPMLSCAKEAKRASRFVSEGLDGLCAAGASGVRVCGSNVGVTGSIMLSTSLYY